MKTPTPPPAPDPNATVAAQTAASTAAAKTQQQMNMVDQTTPYGSLNYTQNGTWADGTPRFSSTQTLSPAEQSNLDQQHQFDSLVNSLGIQQTQKLTGLLDKPVDLSNDATEARLMDLGTKRLDPEFTRQQDALETRLSNQGINSGTEAYQRAMDAFGRQKNDAYNQLLLSGHGQSVQEALTQRNQPINEITALMSGGQVTQPNFMNTPTANVAAPDVVGANQLAYQGNMNIYNQQMGQQNALYGALGSIGGTALGGWGYGGFKMPKVGGA